MAGFDNCCCVKRVQGMRARVVMKSIISDRTIPPTSFLFTERVALVKGRVLCIGSLLWLRSISFVTCTPLDRFRVNKGYTHSQYFMHCTVSHCPYFRR